MSNQAITLRAGDSGQKINITLTNTDGTPYVIPATPTITFQAYVDGEDTAMKFEDTTHISVVSAPNGEIYYTVQDGDFDDDEEGKYWGRVKVAATGIVITTIDEIEITVKGKFTSGE